MTTVYKEYRYTQANGKTVTIKRTWTHHPSNKKVVLDNWFENCQPRTKIVDAYNDFNTNNDVKVSYTTFYKRYITKFGRRRDQSHGSGEALAIGEQPSEQPVIDESTNESTSEQ